MLKNQVFSFPQIIRKDNIPLRLPNLDTNGLTVECESSIKFLGVRTDENKISRNYIDTVEHKISKKDFLLLYQGKHYFEENCRKQNYFAYMHA